MYDDDPKFVVRGIQNPVHTCSINSALQCFLVIDFTRRRFGGAHTENPNHSKAMENYMKAIGGTSLTHHIRKALQERCLHSKNPLSFGHVSEPQHRIEELFNYKFRKFEWRRSQAATVAIITFLSHEATCANLDWSDTSFAPRTLDPDFISEFVLEYSIKKSCLRCHRKCRDVKGLSWGLWLYCALGVNVEHTPNFEEFLEDYDAFKRIVKGRAKAKRTDKYVTLGDVLTHPWGRCDKCRSKFVESDGLGGFSVKGTFEFRILMAPRTLIYTVDRPHGCRELRSFVFEEELDVTHFLDPRAKERYGRVQYRLVAIADNRVVEGIGHSVAYVKASKYVNEDDMLEVKDDIWYEIDDTQICWAKLSWILERRIPCMLIYERVDCKGTIDRERNPVRIKRGRPHKVSRCDLAFIEEFVD